MRYNARFHPVIYLYMPPSLSLIVVNYNSWQVLINLLKSLITQNIDSVLVSSLEVIVVDNSSSQIKPDLTTIKKILTQNNILLTYLQESQNIGFAAGCNNGAKHSDSELLLFCNPDIEIPEQGLNRLIKSYFKLPVDILAPLQVDGDGKPQKIMGRFPIPARYIPLIGGFFKQSVQPKNREDLTYCDWISGAVVLIKHEDFKKLGGWDEDYFMFMEDVDLCRRASQLGLITGVTGTTTWMHHHGVSSKHNLSDRVRSKTAALMAKHIYIDKHFKGWRKPLSHGLVKLKYLPELMLGWLLSWLIPHRTLLSRRLILQAYLKPPK